MDFTTYVVQRTTEHTHTQKLAKFSLVKTLVENLDPERRVFASSPAVLLHLRQYLRDGAFYAETEAAVAMEGAE